MTDKESLEQPPQWAATPDPMGYNIPPNERFMREEEDWQPEFEPLGQPQAGQQSQAGERTPEATVHVPPVDSPGEAMTQHSPFAGGDLYRGWGGHHWPVWPGRRSDWIWPIVAVVVVTSLVSGGWWWGFFLIWPGLSLLKRLRRGGHSGLGLMMIAAGTVMLFVLMGVGTALIAPLLLVGLGVFLLLRSVGMLDAV